MLSRRELLSGAALNGATGVSSTEAQDAEAIRRVAWSLDRIREELLTTRMACAPAICPEVEQIRSHQRAFLKSSQKFPDFIDVGIGTWERVHDWHLHTRQPIMIARRPDARYAMTFGSTILLLRADVRDDFIGFPYDGG